MPLMMHRPADIPVATGRPDIAAPHSGVSLGRGIRRVRTRYITGPRRGHDQLPDPVPGGGARTLEGMAPPLAAASGSGSGSGSGQTVAGQLPRRSSNPAALRPLDHHLRGSLDGMAQTGPAACPSRGYERTGPAARPAAQHEHKAKNRPAGIRGIQSQASSPGVRATGQNGRRSAKASGYANRSFRPDAVRYMTVTTTMHRPTVTHNETCRDKKKRAAGPRFRSQEGRFHSWWQVLGSNQRRLSRRFYRPRVLKQPYTS